MDQAKKIWSPWYYFVQVAAVRSYPCFEHGYVIFSSVMFSTLQKISSNLLTQRPGSQPGLEPSKSPWECYSIGKVLYTENTTLRFNNKTLFNRKDPEHSFLTTSYGMSRNIRRKAIQHIALYQIGFTGNTQNHTWNHSGREYNLMEQQWYTGITKNTKPCPHCCWWYNKDILCIG